MLELGDSPQCLRSCLDCTGLPRPPSFHVLLRFVFARNGIKKVVQLLIQLRSIDKARLVAREHNMEEQVKDV